jgi:hypothetical protein
MTTLPWGGTTSARRHARYCELPRGIKVFEIAHDRAHDIAIVVDNGIASLVVSRTHFDNTHASLQPDTLISIIPKAR